MTLAAGTAPSHVPKNGMPQLCHREGPHRGPRQCEHRPLQRRPRMTHARLERKNEPTWLPERLACTDPRPQHKAIESAG